MVHQAKMLKGGLSAESSARALVLIACLLSIVLSFYQIKPAYSQTIHVPDEFDTIQEAVNNATAGYTIQVGPGIYYEHVEVTKSLTIIGEDPLTTIVDGTANGTVFDLEEASNVNIAGFTIRNAGNSYNAIALTKALPANDYHQIINNIITTSQHGVFVSHSRSNTIFNNTFVSNGLAGICLNDADNVNITANTIADSAHGIKMTSTLDADIIGNTIYQTSYAVHITSSSTGTTIRHNLISGQTAGVYSTSDSTTIDHNTIEEGAYGVYFYNCYDGAVYYNTFMNNSYGIRLYMPTSSASSHNIDNNKILNTDWALELVNADGNTFTGNWIQQNTYGIYMSSSSSNTVYHNNFVNNNMQTYSGIGTGNQWDNGYPSGGNYWSDYADEDNYSGPDQDQPGGDGIGDASYRILPMGYDDYPLMTTWSEHDVSIQSVTVSTNEINPYLQPIVNITVTVINRANISVSETFNVTAKYNLNIIGTKPVSDLAQGATETLEFNWNTSLVAPGNHAISAEASTVPDELNTDNNVFIDGEATVILMGDITGPEDPPGGGEYPPDGRVDGWDMTAFGKAYGSTPGASNWNEDADITGPEDPPGSGQYPPDGVVDGWDVTAASKNYGISI